MADRGSVTRAVATGGGIIPLQAEAASQTAEAAGWRLQRAHALRYKVTSVLTRLSADPGRRTVPLPTFAAALAALGVAADAQPLAALAAGRTAGGADLVDFVGFFEDVVALLPVGLAAPNAALQALVEQDAAGDALAYGERLMALECRHAEERAGLEAALLAERQERRGAGRPGVLILVGPRGVGKSTLARALAASRPGELELVVKHNTRPR